jgi:DNA polymerase III subunit epsilon
MAENHLTRPFIARYQSCFSDTWTDETTINQVRFVVVDSETTGLNPQSDRIISIGAVAVRDGEILLDDSFECLLKVISNTSAVTVHGVTRDESQKGMEEPAALELFLDYLKDGVIVGHHVGHDLATFDAAYERHWNFRLSNRCIDTLTLTLHLEKDGAFIGRAPIRRLTLDALCEAFGVVPHDRHTAGGDAFITAQVLLRLLRFAARNGREKLGRLSEPFEEEA